MLPLQGGPGCLDDDCNVKSLCRMGYFTDSNRDITTLLISSSKLYCVSFQSELYRWRKVVFCDHLMT